jgi:hypothetical protein
VQAEITTRHRMLLIGLLEPIMECIDRLQM